MYVASHSFVRQHRPRLDILLVQVLHACAKWVLRQDTSGRHLASLFFLGEKRCQCRSLGRVRAARYPRWHATRNDRVERFSAFRPTIPITLITQYTWSTRPPATQSRVIIRLLPRLRRDTAFVIMPSLWGSRVHFRHRNAGHSDPADFVGGAASLAPLELAIDVDYRKYGVISLSKRAVGPVRDVRGAAQNVPFTSHKESVVHHRRQHVNEVFGRMMHKSRVSMFIQVDDGVRCSRSVTPTRAFERGGEVAKSTVLTREKRLARGPPCLCGIRDGLSLDRFLIKDVHRIP